MSEEQEKFPNLHSRTIGVVTTLVAIMTYLLCDSGIINHAK